MLMLRERAFGFLVLVLAATSALGEGEQQFADFAECVLVSGEAIDGCRVGYRTFGRLSEDKDNAILFPSWFVGTSQDYVDFGYIGAGAFADSSRYFIIAVDAFGNGVSSSPSNSPLQPGRQFPDVRIEDMVNAQHRLLTEVLGIHRLHAVIGLSMGGMQAFDWAVRYPEFMSKAVSVIGTPKQTSYDLLLWNAQLDAIRNLGGADYEATVRIVAALDNLVTYTPAYIAAQTPPAELPDFMSLSVARTTAYGLDNRVPQLKAMINHDISAHFGGSMQRAADAVIARFLIVVSPTDHMVNPQPSREFARISGAKLHELPGHCGHIAVACEKAELTRVVLEFLQD